jgi:hypothetical protein
MGDTGSGEAMSETAVGSKSGSTYQLGVSRPPLEMADLPTPEEVWRVPRVGRREALKYAVGPSFIALGAAIGSGEWLLGPLSVGKNGFIGIGWILMASILLQILYNIECSRYVIATGEVPIVGFARVPPGRFFWVPFSLALIFFAYIWGGWAKGAADGLFALLKGRVPTPDERTARPRSSGRWPGSPPSCPGSTGSCSTTTATRATGWATVSASSPDCGATAAR